MAFWGLVLEPKKKYTQSEVEQPFHVSMAALDLQNCDANEEASSVVLKKGDSDFILCNLSKKRGLLNVPLNLDFEMGGEINFHILGNSAVHLTGYIIEEDMEDMEGFESDDSMEEEEVGEKPKGDTFKNTKKLLEESSKRKPDANVQNKSKKPKVEAAVEEEEDEDDSDFDMEEDDDSDILGEEEEEEDSSEEDEDDVPLAPKVDAKKQKQGDKPAGKQNNVALNAQQGKKDKKGPATPQQNKGQNAQQNKASNGSQQNGAAKRVVQGGVQIEELKAGDGQAAKAGRMVSVEYVGRLKSNNKIFDSSTGGRVFKFRLGAGEVIKGWDVGVAGMKVGSKRRLTIPAKMAYGAQGSPPVIPPNSTLVFEVELKNVK